MVFDYEKAMEERKDKKEKRLGIGPKTAESSNEITAENGQNIYNVYLEVKNQESPILLYGIKANNPAEAFLKACNKLKLDEKQLVKSGCRIKDTESKELFLADGTPCSE